MFNSTKPKSAAMPIATLIGAETVVEGNIRFKGGLRVDGRIVGNVMAEEGAPATLVLSENGAIEGEVRAGHVVCNGRITGPVFAAELLELQSKARVTGNVHYRALEMQHGAVIEGQLSHTESERPGLKLAATNG